MFISYAHLDNESAGDEPGWVELFHGELQLWLRRISGWVDAEVWRDPALKRAQLFDAVIQEAVNDSAVLIALITPAYLNSRYCAQEIAWFHEKASKEPAGFVVENSVRVIPVLLYNLPPEEWPEVCQGTSAFRFHQGEGKGVPLDPGSLAFRTQLQALAGEMAEVLERVEKNTIPAMAADVPHDVVAEADEDRFTVFLAQPSYGLEPTHRQLRNALKAEGIRVLADMPPPYEVDEHATAVRAAVAQADLSVHLLGSAPGEPISADEPEVTFPFEQARIALEEAPSQLILLPDEFEIDAVRAGHYSDFIRSLAGQEREAQRLEVVKSGRRQMLEQILVKRRRLAEAASRLVANVGGRVGTAFIDLHSKDMAHAIGLVQWLEERGVTPMMIPSASDAPAMGPFAENLMRADLFIVVFGGVSRTWVDNRLEEALKLIVTKRLPYRPAVYLAPPEKPVDDPGFPGVFEVLKGQSDIEHLLDTARRR